MENIFNKNDELKVIVLTKRLIKHTMTITDNQNRFPKKARFTLVAPMQKTVIEIYKLLLKANYLNTNIKEQFTQRQLCQSEAIYNCDVLLLYIELALDSNYINDKSCEYWVRQVMEVKKMIFSWKNGDAKRSSF
jgi:hypothetical protein